MTKCNSLPRKSDTGTSNNINGGGTSLRIQISAPKSIIKKNHNKTKTPIPPYRTATTASNLIPPSTLRKRECSKRMKAMKTETSVTSRSSSSSAQSDYNGNSSEVSSSTKEERIKLRKKKQSSTSPIKILVSAESLPALEPKLMEALKDRDLDFPINEECTSLCFSPSGRLLIACFSDGTIRLFDLTGIFQSNDNDDDSSKVGNNCDDISNIFDSDSSSSSSSSSGSDSESEFNTIPSPTTTSSKKRNYFVSSNENQLFGAVACQIHAKGVHTSLLMDVDCAQDSQYCFAGVLRGSMELVAIHLGQLERYYNDYYYDADKTKQQVDVNLLDLITVYKHSDAKLRGFGACTRLNMNNYDEPPKYLLFTGKAIKNIHIWSFQPPSSDGEEEEPIWQQLYNTQANGNTISLLQFRYDPNGLLQGISKSDPGQKLRVWDLSYEQHQGNVTSPFYTKTSVLQKHFDKNNKNYPKKNHTKGPPGHSTTQQHQAQERPKRPPFLDIQNSQATMGVCGGFCFCSGGDSSLYNQMSVISLDDPNSIQSTYNHTELAFPEDSTASNASNNNHDRNRGRRQQRGDLKHITSVAGMVVDTHALVELSDGSIIKYTQNNLFEGSNKKHNSKPQQQQCVPKLKRMRRSETGFEVLPEGFSRKLCVARIGSQGLIVAAVSVYNPATGRGRVALRPFSQNTMDHKMKDEGAFWGYSEAYVSQSQLQPKRYLQQLSSSSSPSTPPTSSSIGTTNPRNVKKNKASSVSSNNDKKSVSPCQADTEAIASCVQKPSSVPSPIENFSLSSPDHSTFGVELFKYEDVSVTTTSEVTAASTPELSGSISQNNALNNGNENQMHHEEGYKPESVGEKKKVSNVSVSTIGSKQVIVPLKRKAMNTEQISPPAMFTSSATNSKNYCNNTNKQSKRKLSIVENDKPNCSKKEEMALPKKITKRASIEKVCEPTTVASTSSNDPKKVEKKLPSKNETKAILIDDSASTASVDSRKNSSTTTDGSSFMEDKDKSKLYNNISLSICGTSFSSRTLETSISRKLSDPVSVLRGTKRPLSAIAKITGLTDEKSTGVLVPKDSDNNPACPVITSNILKMSNDFADTKSKKANSVPCVAATPTSSNKKAKYNSGQAVATTQPPVKIPASSFIVTPGNGKSTGVRLEKRVATAIGKVDTLASRICNPKQSDLPGKHENTWMGDTSFTQNAQIKIANGVFDKQKSQTTAVAEPTDVSSDAGGSSNDVIQSPSSLMGDVTCKDYSTRPIGVKKVSPERVSPERDERYLSEEDKKPRSNGAITNFFVSEGSSKERVPKNSKLLSFTTLAEPRKDVVQVANDPGGDSGTKTSSPPVPRKRPRSKPKGMETNSTIGEEIHEIASALIECSKLGLKECKPLGKTKDISVKSDGPSKSAPELINLDINRQQSCTAEDKQQMKLNSKKTSKSSQAQKNDVNNERKKDRSKMKITSLESDKDQTEDRGAVADRVPESSEKSNSQLQQHQNNEGTSNSPSNNINTKNHINGNGSNKISPSTCKKASAKQRPATTAITVKTKKKRVFVSGEDLRRLCIRQQKRLETMFPHNTVKMSSSPLLNNYDYHHSTVANYNHRSIDAIHQAARTKLTAEHHAAHTRIQKKVLSMVHKIIHALVKNSTSSVVGVGVEQAYNSLREDLDSYEEMLQEILRRQEMEAATLSAKHSFEKLGLISPMVQVCFPFQNLFAEARKFMEALVVVSPKMGDIVDR